MYMYIHQNTITMIMPFFVLIMSRNSKNYLTEVALWFFLPRYIFKTPCNDELDLRLKCLRSTENSLVYLVLNAEMVIHTIKIWKWTCKYPFTHCPFTFISIKQQRKRKLSPFHHRQVLYPDWNLTPALSVYSNTHTMVK